MGRQPDIANSAGIGGERNFIIMRKWIAEIATAATIGSVFAGNFTVEIRNGVPIITNDGTPVPARMFWGNIHSQWSSVEIGKGWKEIAFSFQSGIDCDHAALHLRFGDPPTEGWIELEGLQMTQAAPSEITVPRTAGKIGKDVIYWCNGIRENPPVAVQLESPGNLRIELGGDKNKLKGFHVLWQKLKVGRGKQYEIRFRVRSNATRSITPTVHRQGQDFMMLGGLAQRNVFSDQIRLAAASGIDFITFSIFGIWQEPEKAPDYSALKLACDTILKAHPDAKLIPRVDLRFPPEWWAKCHPEELMVFDPELPNRYPSMASELFQKEAAEALRKVIRFCEDHYSDHMAGYHITGGNTQEWFYYNAGAYSLSGYDLRTRKAWRNWLTKRYRTDSALRKAWDVNHVSLATVEIPSSKRRRTDGHNVFFHPREYADVLDFMVFRQEMIGDSILHLAKVVRDETGKSRLCLTFYGYTFEFASMGNGPGVTGHYMLEKLLDSPDVDIICSPISYRDRQLGGGCAIMTPAESIMRAGKLYLLEDDTSTHIATANGNAMAGWEAGVACRDESVQLLRRNLMAAFSHNFAFWWMDLQGTGWFNDPVLWKQQQFFRDWEHRNLETPSPYRPEIGVFLDEKSLQTITGPGITACTTAPLIAKGRADLNRIGTPYGQYLLKDLLSSGEQFKLYIILAAYALNAKERAQLKNGLAGKAVIWAYAPGYLDIDRRVFSPAAVEAVCGFQVREEPPEIAFEVTSTKDGRELGLPEKFGPGPQTQPGKPVLAVIPKEKDRVLAVYSNGAPAVVLRKNVLFCGTTRIPPELYRMMAEISGCHLYTKDAAAIFAGNGYVGVCASKDGPVTMNFPASVSSVREIFSDQHFSSSKLTLEMKKGECRLFQKNPEKSIPQSKQEQIPE